MNQHRPVYDCVKISALTNPVSGERVRIKKRRIEPPWACEADTSVRCHYANEITGTLSEIAAGNNNLAWFVVLEKTQEIGVYWLDELERL